MLVFEETVGEKQRRKPTANLSHIIMHWQIGGRQVISPLASALMVKVNELLSWIFVYFNSSTSDVNPF